MESYSGTDNLEVLKLARNYNQFLIDRVCAFWDGKGVALDFGAGIGSFALPLRSRGHKVFCIETDPDLSSRLKREGLDTGTRLQDFQALKFSYIYTLNVLEHIQDDAAVLKEMMGSLRPGGRLYIYVPAFNLLFSSMDRKVGHFRRYRRSQLKQILERAGYRVEHARYVDSLGFLVTLLYMVIGSKTGDLNPKAVLFFDRVIFPVSRGCDHLLGFFFGKNLEIVATKPEAPSSTKGA